MNLLSNAVKFTRDGIIEVNAWILRSDGDEGDLTEDRKTNI
jgi:hypothetical protein